VAFEARPRVHLRPVTGAVAGPVVDWQATCLSLIDRENRIGSRIIVHGLAA